MYDMRKAFGSELARESHVPADVVVPEPQDITEVLAAQADEALALLLGEEGRGRSVVACGLVACGFPAAAAAPAASG